MCCRGCMLEFELLLHWIRIKTINKDQIEFQFLRVQTFIPLEAISFSFLSASKAERGRVSRELNVKMLFGSNDFQT